MLLLAATLFALVSLFVISSLLLDSRLIGRSLDASVPPVSFLQANVFKMDFYSWWGVVNGGGRNSFSPTLIPINSILYFPTIFHASSWLLSRYQIVITLFFSMFFFFLLARSVIENNFRLGEKKTAGVAALSGLFFGLNNYLFCDFAYGSSVMFLTFAFIPLFLFGIFSYFQTKRQRYFFISLLALIIVSSTIQHLILAYVFIFLFSLLYRDYKFGLKLAGLHILLSLYWLLPFAFRTKELNSDLVTGDFTAGLINSTSNFVRVFINSDYFGNRDLYNLALGSRQLSIAWGISAFLLVAISLFFCIFIAKTFSKKTRGLLIVLLLVFFLSVIFAKGGKEPFGQMVVALYKYIPVFNIYRSSQRFLSYEVISISLLFAVSAAWIVKRDRRYFIPLLVLVVINAMPWWLSRDLGAEKIAEEKVPAIGLHDLTKGDKAIYDLNKLPLNFAMMPIPPGISIEFNPINPKNFKTQGGDPGLNFGNKIVYATEGSMGVFKENLDFLEREMYSDPDFFNNYKNNFALLNVRYFIERKDTMPVFSKNSAVFDLKNVEQAASKADFLETEYEDDTVKILKNNYFLPHLYIPDKLEEAKDIRGILELQDQPIKSAILVNSFQNCSSLVMQAETSSMTVEYRKVNPTRYQVVIHRANGKFPLIFSESFSSGWKLRLLSQKTKAKEDLQKNLVALNLASSPDQADQKEIEQYIKDGKISTVSAAKSSFISKEFEGTIQNDNLESKMILPFTTAVNENTHFLANGYANGWLMDADQLCKGTVCSRNDDGSYDISAVIDFAPQKGLYSGLVISGATLCLLVLYVSFKRFAYAVKKH